MNDSRNPKTAEFIEALVKPFDVEEKLKNLGSFDKIIPQLYLNEKTISAFDAYQKIILSAAMMIKILAIPLGDKSNLLNKNFLSKTVIDLVPISKEGFEKFGEGYAYHWTSYFHDQILTLLRHEISGVDELTRATKSAESLALDARRAQLNVRSSLEAAGLPKSFVKAEPAADL